MQPEMALEIENVSMRFGHPSAALTAVDRMSFGIREGEFVSIIGPSGCGKSTLFNIVGGLIGGYEGSVRVGKDTVRGPHPSVGMVFQEESTFPWRTVLDNVAFPLEVKGVQKAERYARARHFIELV